VGSRETGRTGKKVEGREGRQRERESEPHGRRAADDREGGRIQRDSWRGEGARARGMKSRWYNHGSIRETCGTERITAGQQRGSARGGISTIEGRSPDSERGRGVGEGVGEKKRSKAENESNGDNGPTDAPCTVGAQAKWGREKGSMGKRLVNQGEDGPSCPQKYGKTKASGRQEGAAERKENQRENRAGEKESAERREGAPGEGP